MNLTPTEIDHLLYVLEVNKRDRWHTGNQRQYENRAARIEKKLKAELAFIKEIKKEAYD